MHDEHNGQNPALTELRERLKGGMARMRLNQTDLATRAGLGRTTVSEALSPTKPAPSSETVAALARALQLPVEQLRELQRSAVEDIGGGVRSGPGRPIGEWDPHDLEVHPAGPGVASSGPGRPQARTLPEYVRREHDRVLSGVVEDAAVGRSGAVVLVGGSSTGKTRACWEAVQPLAAQGWRLWHPFDPTRAQDALEDLPRVAPRTVVWLNEAQHYLGDRVAGERIAAAVHRLLVTVERGPVLVLGTLWPEYAARYTALPSPGESDPYSRVRELLAGRVLNVPESFDAPALAAAAALAESGDRLLDDALSRAGAEGRVTQDLAGAPELINRYRHATPAAAAVLKAAMDARRLGVGLHLPQAFLTDAAADYLTDTDYDQLTDDWAEQAFAELAALVHGKQAPLRRTTPRTRRRPGAPAPSSAAHSAAPSTAGPVFRLADYLEQHGRTSRTHLCPPASFWHAAHTHLTDPGDLGNLTDAAESRHRLQWAHCLRQRAADHGNPDALYRLALMREESGDREGAEALAQQAAERGHTNAPHFLAGVRERAGDREGAEALAWQAANQGSPDTLYHLAGMRERAGDREGAEALVVQATNHGHTGAPISVALIRQQGGDQEGAEVLAQQAIDRGESSVLLCILAMMREQAGDSDGAEPLYRQAVAHGNTDAMYQLAGIRERAGDSDGAEPLYQQAAERGHSSALLRLAAMRERAGDRDGAEALVRQTASRGHSSTLYLLAEMRKEAGDWDGAEALYRQAADHGHTNARSHLAAMRERAGDRDGAEALARQTADRGHFSALLHLARKRDEAGDRDGAETLARQAADRGDTAALYRLAEKRECAGDRDGAQALARQTADYGSPQAHYRRAEKPGLFSRLWPYGLDPDGAPTTPWRASVSIERSRHVPLGTS
ncbi:helix-turn-helix domain-containing protein [Streptomyces anulatus]|uniref:helix-turn-helix domain-containing protein n=1 Tax=Streptomyces anulatus TaxID=1892 RepID=UPI00386C6C30|nr:helix-turn-helix domain-containing protein [Streptomyces anulatus]